MTSPLPASRGNPMKSAVRWGGGIIALLLLLLLGSCGIGMVGSVIQPGDVGVKIKTLGTAAGVDPKPYPSGWNFKGCPGRCAEGGPTGSRPVPIIGSRPRIAPGQGPWPHVAACHKRSLQCVERLLPGSGPRSPHITSKVGAPRVHIRNRLGMLVCAAALSLAGSAQTSMPSRLRI